MVYLGTDDMIRFLVLAVLVCGAFAVPPSERVFACYHTNWSQYRPSGGTFFPYDIDPFLCTHVIYSFAKIANGVLAPYEWNDESTEWSKGMFEHFTDLKMQNPDLKCLLAVGGWTHGSKGFTGVVESASSRKKFIDHSITYLRKWGFDGLDLDWEYPGDNVRSDDPQKKPENKERFTALCQELRAAYEADATATGSPRLLLTAAVAAGEGNMDAAYEIPQISQSLDFINLMSYDLRGAWEPMTGHHTTTRPSPEDTADVQLLTVEWAAKEWLNRGCPKDKLVLGLGTYGRTFTLADSNQHGINAPATKGGSAGTWTRESGFWSYYEVCEKLLKNGFKTDYDPVRQVIYAYSTTEWVGYDDLNSLYDKGKIIDELDLLGGMTWALDLDDFRGAFCGQGTWPMIKTMKAMIAGGTYEPPSPTTRDPNAPTLPPTEYPPGQFCRNKPDGTYPHETDCTKYYECHQNGETVERQCASGLVFNPDNGQCVWPDSCPKCNC